MTWLVAALVVAAALYLWHSNFALARNMPKIGDVAPDFALPDQNGTPRRLDEFRGKWLVLYFYPRDDTPGCAEQAMRFRNAMRELEALGAAVCGISVDSTQSHAAFARKYNLPFTLLADRKGEVAARYGSLRDFGLIKLAKRNTFLIDGAGRVAAVYTGVSPARNAQDVSDALKKLAPT
jgi:peroxiredoxin Q/BCP